MITESRTFVKNLISKLHKRFIIVIGFLRLYLIPASIMVRSHMPRPKWQNLEILPSQGNKSLRPLFQQVKLLNSASWPGVNFAS